MKMWSSSQESLDKSPPEGWSCPMCTFDNAASRPGCEICGTSQPESNTAPQPRQPRPPEFQTLTEGGSLPLRKWRCISCDHLNSTSRRACDRCSAAQPMNVLRQRASWPELDGDWNCHGCGRTNDAAQPKCEKCGRRRSAEDIPNVLEPSVDKNWRCSRCGRFNGDGIQMCLQCRSRRISRDSLQSENENAGSYPRHPDTQPDSPPQATGGTDSPVLRRRISGDRSGEDTMSGWPCPCCTYVNEPGRPGCEICCYSPPESSTPEAATRQRLETPQSRETWPQQQSPRPWVYRCSKCANVPDGSECAASCQCRSTGNEKVNRWTCFVCQGINIVFREKCRTLGCDGQRPPITDDVRRSLTEVHRDIVDASPTEVAIGSSGRTSSDKRLVSSDPPRVSYLSLPVTAPGNTREASFECIVFPAFPGV